LNQTKFPQIGLSEPILAKVEQSWHRLNNQWLTHRSPTIGSGELALIDAPDAEFNRW
jgi:hypothetical protein